ncbi:FtsX-like permease family protein [Streptomyces sp. CBMA123]|uniref:FtsX-like permease family protein n=1 Tax=Streptomyces sp. CBMA123 TaxID=1896313 RepID=UPI001661E9CB|nr:FtsX-like permease family protein [Streptomyces sp. CBMA123]MBD0691659.1 ABC transporter permease [Streptomyces sp. CBMA123]
MIPFSLRLAVSGGREAVARLLMIAAAVAIGVGLLLSTLSSMNAIDRANERQLWMNTGAKGATAATSADPLWWGARGDYYRGKRVFRVDLAPTGPTSPVVPGLSRLPAPGEYYASPALEKLLRDTPAVELGDRFPGRLVGTLGEDALPSPDTLALVVGRTADEVKALPRAHTVTGIATALPDNCEYDCYGAGVHGDALVLVLTVVAAALIFPVLIFIGTATRLSAATREQRYAAMRLVGATPGQVSVMSAVESTVAAVVGTVVGFGLYVALKPLVADVPFTGDRFFAGDLSLTLPQVAGVALGVPVAAALAARFALRRVTISPLGVSRRVTPKPPSPWRLAPLVAGLAELGYFVGNHPKTTDGQSAGYLSGFVLVMLGLVIAGPWLTLATARVVARRTSRPASLIAMRRLADDPRAGFRSVAGLVLALFVTTGTLGIMSTINANQGLVNGAPEVRKAIVATPFGNKPDATALPSVPDRVLAQARAVPGFRGIALVHDNPAGIGAYQLGERRVVPSLVSCAELAQIPVVGHCAPGAAVAAVDPYQLLDLTDGSGHEWPAAQISAEAAVELPVRMLYATTDGSEAAKEQLRTLFTKEFPTYEPRLAEDWSSEGQKKLQGWRQLANVVLLTTLPIAGCSLAVSVVAGLSDRRRPFAMLRLTGAPLRLLHRVVGLESALPLLVVSALAIGTGFAAAAMFLTSQMGYDLVSPDLTYYGLTGFGLAASLGIIASTLPLLRRITGPEAARNG